MLRATRSYHCATPVRVSRGSNGRSLPAKNSFAARSRAAASNSGFVRSVSMPIWKSSRPSDVRNRSLRLSRKGGCRSCANASPNLRAARYQSWSCAVSVHRSLGMLIGRSGVRVGNGECRMLQRRPAPVDMRDRDSDPRRCCANTNSTTQDGIRATTDRSPPSTTHSSRSALASTPRADTCRSKVMSRRPSLTGLSEAAVPRR